MKKLMMSIIGLCIMFLAACSGQEQQTSSETDSWVEKDWSEIEELAAGTTVNLFMWGGDDGINRYIDEWVTPRLEEEHDITLRRTPLDTPEILQKLLVEKQANQENGTIDMIWLNGENFKNAKENELLAQPFVEKLPNYQTYIDGENPAFLTDFGTATEGLEAPWGRVQFVFFYDSAKIDSPPATIEEFVTWIQENPGRFTYPEASDFTGNAFLRHMLYYATNDQLYTQDFDEAMITEQAEPMWEQLRELKPALWREGETYPATLTDLDRLYSQGEVWMTMGYNEARAEQLIESGTFPETTRSFVLDVGSIGNTHFLSIPFNSPNKEGALVTINGLLSPEAQLEKLKPDGWGENTVLSLDLLSDEQREQLETIERGESVLAEEVLEEAFLPELDSNYVDWLKEHWVDEVVQTD
ncbi:ABC transporter substrate-binding protein [Shouchella shacheensis]|uniref:ABC transporter substrate-binding protein n=1 Tax=Shouchella shacheensis TaxID=1649580 RepID=UPI0007401C90|nr:ABC transporter substrate-binding protein [Shouchella shacheensis]